MIILDTDHLSALDRGGAESKRLRMRLAMHQSSEVIEIGIRKKEYWWEVPIRPSKEPKSATVYYEALADVEDVVAQREKVDVFLVPTNGASA